MTAYALGHLRTTDGLHEEILEYMERIQATLDPFDGRFAVHGAEPEVREGHWPGALVLIRFPSIEQARDWYDSAAYQAIVPLRARHMEGEIVLIDGVGPDHDSAALAAGLRAAHLSP
ncbi:DUF1330 domain-containing protein [Nonomuraea sp. NPDC000554]|uniref:DUF1330 domain-containing protein n=1 Tax=Nonomuraea sp. NPDC000554 TaxID=3154259 RepID=UPI003318EFE6